MDAPDAPGDADTTLGASAQQGYPVSFDAERPARFDRPQVFLRIFIFVLLGSVGGTTVVVGDGSTRYYSSGWGPGLLYLLLPTVAAALLSAKASGRFLAEDAPRLAALLRWLAAISAYLAFVTDRFPTRRPEQLVHYEVRPEGAHTVGSALLRVIYSIPSAFVLALLWIPGALVWIFALLAILIAGTYPRWAHRFLRGLTRWGLRLAAYQTSLVSRYPPFSLR